MTITHEFGHYGLYLPDEYEDIQTGQGTVSVPFCNNCLMSNSSDIDLHTEYCTNANHNYSHPMAEADSCWHQVKIHYPGVTEYTDNATLDQNGPVLPENLYPEFEIHYPDLVVAPEDIVLDTLDPKEGEEVEISVTFHNLDDMIYGDVVDVKIYNGLPVDNKVIDTKSISISGVDNTIQANWIPDGGEQMLFVIVDSGSDVVEWDDIDNNRASQNFSIKAKPEISTGLGDQQLEEDTPLVLNLKPYESDIESGDEDLLWRVNYYNPDDIASVEGEESADDIITIIPVDNFNGETSITLELTDEDGLYDNRDITINWLPVNDAPAITNISPLASSVTRTESVDIEIELFDPEEQTGSLTPEVEVKSENETVWTDVSTKLVSDYFVATFTPDADAPIGVHDIRARARDPAMEYGPWSYLNGSLLVENGLPVIDSLDYDDDILYRTEGEGFTLMAEDAEDDPEDLMIRVEVLPKGKNDWDFDAILTEFDSTTATYEGDGEWKFDLVLPADTRKGICDLRVMLVDLDDGESQWVYVNETFDVRNSLPKMGSINASAMEVFRTEEIILTIKGTDGETSPEELKLLVEHKTKSGDWSEAYYSENSVQYDSVTGEWSVPYSPPKNAKTGSYDIRATLEDGDIEVGIHIELEGNVEVKNNLPAIVVKDIPTLQAGAAHYFDCRESSDVEDAKDLTYSWDFGDGRKGKGSRATHTYSGEGTYKLELTVTDKDGGVSTEEISVRVEGGGLVGGGSDMLLIGAIAAVIVIVIVFVVIIMKVKGLGPFT
jgi:hypothetical protein